MSDPDIIENIDKDLLVSFSDTHLENAVTTEIEDKYGVEVSDKGLTVGNLMEADELVLSSKGISDLEGMQYALNLEVLDVSNNNIVDVEPISKLPKLKTLNLSNNNIEDIASLTSLIKLETLNVSDNQIKSVEDIHKLTNLKYLNIENNNLDNPSISYLESLSDLNVQMDKPVFLGYANDDEDIVFHGLSDLAFDKDTTTFHKGVGTVTWDGNLTHRELTIKGSGYTWKSTYNTTQVPLVVTFYASNGSKIAVLNNLNEDNNVSFGNTADTITVVVPDGATKMTFSGKNYPENMKIHEISVTERKDRPKDVNLDVKTTTSSTIFSWDKVNRAIIYRDGILISDVTNSQTFTDTPLYSDKEYVYDIIFIDENGNGQKVTKNVKTDKHIVAFRGLNENAFDSSMSTYHTGVGKVTWDGDLSNREIHITGMGYTWVSTYNTSYVPLKVTFYNAQGSKIYPTNTKVLDTPVSDRSLVKTISVVVPEGAVSMVFSGDNYSEKMRIYDISLPETSERPKDIALDVKTTTSSTIFSWDKVNRAIIYRDGLLISDVKDSQTFTDTPLYSDKDYVYDIIFMDDKGNGKKVRYIAKTDKYIVAFRGLNADAFDGNQATFHKGIGTVTWEGDLEGKELAITGMGYTWRSTYSTTQVPLVVTFLNASGTKISSANLSAGSIVRTVNVVVPKGATSMLFSGTRNPELMQIHDIEITK